MEGGSGPRGGVHNKQMFILSGFIISDPDCTYLEHEKIIRKLVNSQELYIYYTNPKRVEVYWAHLLEYKDY